LSVRGGIFTQALVRSLRGDADHNRDGLIQLGELHMEVERQVVAEARLYGENQLPTLWRDRSAGLGSVLWFLDDFSGIGLWGWLSN
jgi:hypothetical protein